jgi:hypothetical protein
VRDRKSEPVYIASDYRKLAHHLVGAACVLQQAHLRG